MKRIIYSLGLMLAATLTLTNCAKEIDAPVVESEGVPFEIVASTADTKTVNDGMSTKWEAEDQINLFHAVAGSTTYVNDAAFTVEDAATGLFKGTLAEELTTVETYDWYAFYPYSSYTTTPANTSGGRTYIGCRSDKSQAQVGLDNMKHIAGANYPMYGYARSVSADAKPTIDMTHVSSLIEIVVTNTLSEDLNVENISFTAPEDIVGNYYVNFAGEECTFTKYDTFQSNTANLTVSDAVIPAGGEGKFYLAVKPFTAPSGSELSLSVNGYNGNGPLTMTKDVTFAAGKIKTLNFTYDYVIPEGTERVEIVSSELGVENGTAVTSLSNGLVVFAEGTNSSNSPKFYTSDSSIRMYMGNTVTVTAPSGNVLTEISFTFVNSYTNLSCTNSNTYENGTWKGELSQVIFNVPTSDQARITSIVVCYKPGEEEAAVIESIEVVDPKTDYLVNSTFEEPTVNAVYSNGTITPVEGAVFTGYDLSEVGEQTVNVTYETFSTSYTIVVSKPEGDSYALYSGELVEGDYIIVYDSGAMKASVSSSRLQYLDVDIVNDLIHDPDASIVWHVAKSGDYWTIYNASTESYAAGTGAKNKAQLLADGTDDKSHWTVTGTATYEFINKANAAAGVNKNLRRNGTYGFACYSTSTGGALSLYKKN